MQRSDVLVAPLFFARLNLVKILKVLQKWAAGGEINWRLISGGGKMRPLKVSENLKLIKI
jgi:hypothetical protein